MSGLEALSIACNIMQVISFAHETIDFCKEIYHGGSLNDYNQQSIVSLVELSRQLQTRFQKAKSKTAEETQLANIAQKCNVAARALQEEVKFLESRHAKGNLAATIKIVVKTYWRKSRLERLEKSLRNHQNTMESYLLARVCTQNDAIEIQQSQEFKELGKDIKFFTSQYAAGHTRIVDLIKKELVLVRAEGVKATLQSEESIKMHVTSATNDLIQRMDQCTIESNIKSSTKEQKDQFLNSLRYEGMNQRKNDVTGSFKDTFQWIFDSECGKTPIQLWDNFGDWLKSESNIYWISGKPGSGKSTLMKYLLKSPSTEEALKIWNTGPIILSHFFWKPGFKMQKSIKGFLCSILHQALLSDRVSITLDSILNTSKPLLLKHEAADWDVEELKDLYFTILGTDMFPVCIFLDGLDEICDEDGPFSLLKLIDDLRIHPKVKICVSSRPEPELQSKLCRHQQLKLHDLTHDDMKKFVVGQIQPYINSGKISESFGSKITWSLIWKAEGVFLWLHLASRSLIGGIDKGDTEDILWQRLEEMPNELTKLYSDMWERMNGNSKIYRETAARYFNLLILTREQNLGYTRPGSELRFFQFMGATQTELQDIILEKQSSVSEATFEHIYALSVQAIQVRCAGLLEVNCNNYLDKFLCVRDPTHFNFFKRQNMQVQFIHRTAYDFIKDTEEGHRICAYDSSSSDILRIQLIKGHLIMIRLLWETRGVDNGITRFLECLSKIKDLSLQPLVHDILRCAWVWYHKRCYREIANQFYTMPHFLVLLTRMDYGVPFRNFVLSTIKGSSNPSSLATHVLRNICFHVSGKDWFIKRLDYFLEPLLALGADATSRGTCIIPPHEQGELRKKLVPFISPFAQFVSELAPTNIRLEPTATVRLLEMFMNAKPDLKERIPLIVQLNCDELRVLEINYGIYFNNFGIVSRTKGQDYRLSFSAFDNAKREVLIVLNINVGFLLHVLLMRDPSLETVLRDGQSSKCQPAQLVLICVPMSRGVSTRYFRFRPINTKVTEHLLSLLLQALCGVDLLSEAIDEGIKVLGDIYNGSPNYKVVYESGRCVLAEEDCGYRYKGPEDNHLLGDEWGEHWPEVCSDINNCAEESDAGSL